MMAKPDPFELLQHIVAPEPDAEAMKATIAQSREAFIGRSASRTAHGRSWADRMQDWRFWLVPAGATALVVIAAIAFAPELIPGRDRQTGPLVADSGGDDTPPTFSRSRQTAESNPAAKKDGERMGMRPAPGTSPDTPATATIVDGDNIRIGVRSTPSLLELYLPDMVGAPVIDQQGVLPGELAKVVTAFEMKQMGAIAVRFQSDDVRFWRIYRKIDGVFKRDPELSGVVSDAPDRTEVERRLVESP
ncbi:hypothetical protein [Shinella oryzae]|uniref:Uncharacterized protein n=1 Tax=Shinella oryzae TaxID=2871820 RepID=A0ABY9KBK0_9HYPH|nr:hypothetical protein [Shinella oryzae]WLS05885.1 hypothetical protein Q9315_18630 [Shinella oryzae]